MEENSDTPMETDVSSTTQDLPGVQEQTASTSSGMQVTVEVLENNDIDEFEAENNQDQSIDSNTPESTAEVSTNVVEIESPVKTKESPQKILIKTVTPHKSPVKVPAQSPQKVTLTPQKVLVQSSPQKPPQTSPQKVFIQSTAKSPSPKTPVKVVTPQKTPVKTLPVVKITTKVPSPKEDTNSTSGSDVQGTSVTPNEGEKTNELNQDTETTKVTETIEKTEEDVPKPEIDKAVTTATDKQATPTPETETEGSVDSQLEETSLSESSEKEHNKSLSREMRSLIKSAKESKIINECTQITSKIRKSRTVTDSPNTTLSTPETKKIQGRRGSNNSQKSNCSEKSDKAALKRSMRSQNPDFVTKNKQFLNTVTGKLMKDETEASQGQSEDESTEEIKSTDAVETPSKRKSLIEKINGEVSEKKENTPEGVTTKSGKTRSDSYCWRCHWLIEPDPTKTPASCAVCPRSYHYKCLNGSEKTKIFADKGICPECMAIMNAESSQTRSPAMRKINVGMLCELLKYALNRMMEVNGIEPFLTPVDRTVFPDYDKYVLHPMDLGLIKQNIAAGSYGSTEAFSADVQWIVHNSIIFNTLQSKLTAVARTLFRTCRTEMSEIEACPECYSAAHAGRPTWFTDVCSTPHILLWAKLKGFPYWPGKGMTVSNAGYVDVRFFGAHDRAWVPAKDCFLYSEKDPNNFRTKRQDILDSMLEAEHHIRNLSRKFGKFVYPAFKTQFDPSKINEQLKAMIPGYEGETLRIQSKDKSPSKLKHKRRSKGSKDSNMEGNTSDADEVPAQKRKMADGKEIAGLTEENSAEKDKTMEVDESTDDSISRKRRRSILEEAVITVLDAPAEKKKRLNNSEAVDTKEKQDKKDSEKKDEVTKTPKSSKTEPTEKKTLKSGTPKIVLKLPKNKIKIKPKPVKVKSTPTNSPKPDDKTKKVKKKPQVTVTVHVEEKSKKQQTTSKDKPETPKALNKSLPIIKSNTSTPKSGKVRFSDDIRVETKKSTQAAVGNTPAFLISDVRSLSQKSDSSKTAGSSVFTPTSTENVTNMKEAVAKLQKLRNDNNKPLVGRVGVKAFARMTSPSKITKETVEVEVKTEPLEPEDVDKQSEKIDLLQNFRLMPVAGNLRDVRINKVITAPVQVVRKPAPKAVEPKPRAKKTFPQPKRAEDSALNGKNSMVYIPIQPPITQAPIRAPLRQNGPMPTQLIRPAVPVAISSNNTVNTLTTPLMNLTSMVSSCPPTLPSTVVSTAVPTVGQVPSSVHTVPLITSVNGQWTFGLRPVMSVGGNESNCPQLVNGVAERPLVPIAAAPPTNVLSPAAAKDPPALISAANKTQRTPETVTPGEPPRLQQKPSLVNPFDPNASPTVNDASVPNAAGPVTMRLNQNAGKLAEFFRHLLEDTLEKVDDPKTQMTSALAKLERINWKHSQELEELKHSYSVTASEMRLSFEREKQQIITETRKACQIELDNAVKFAKARQWCANCLKEAQLYCCWNTSYCNYVCQRAHWAEHYAMCTNQRGNGQINNETRSSTDEPLQPPELSKSSNATPPETPPNKARKTCQNANQAQAKPNNTSIVASVADDTNGASVVKCISGIKVSKQQMPAITKQKQKVPDEPKKLTAAPAGYLIVGGGTTPTTQTVTLD